MSRASSHPKSAAIDDSAQKPLWATHGRSLYQDPFRKVVLNALLWIAKAEIPKNGVASKVTEAELKANWDR